MSTSPDLGLPLVASQQATPEVTHNEALLLLSIFVNGVVSMTNTPPGSPAEGDAYILDTAPTGAWAGKAGKLAVWTSGGWRYVPGNDSSGTPIAMGVRQTGMKVYRRDLLADWVWIDSAWVEHAQSVGSV